MIHVALNLCATLDYDDICPVGGAVFTANQSELLHVETILKRAVELYPWGCGSRLWSSIWCLLIIIIFLAKKPDASLFLWLKSESLYVCPHQLQWIALHQTPIYHNIY